MRLPLLFRSLITRTIIGFLLPLCAGILPTMQSVAADRETVFHQAVDEAYDDFRFAANYLRTQNIDVGALRLENMLRKWHEVVKTYAKNPPPAYAKDAQFAASLMQVNDIATQALNRIDTEEKPDGKVLYNSLMPIRDVLAAMRARSNVHTFSDCINTVDRAMQRLWQYRHTPPDFNNAQAVKTFDATRKTVKSAVLQCEREAPATVKNNPQFQRLIAIYKDGFGHMDTATPKGDLTTIINVLREMISANRILFIEFG